MLLIRFLYWIVYDIRYAMKYGRKLHLYGIIAIVGLYGGGKTMALTEYLYRMKLKYGDDVLIATNYYFNGQDFAIESWEDLLKEYDKPIIFGYDELQNEFNSREYKSFPVSLMTLLTQNRKGNGKQIIYTTQDFETVDKNFRRLTKYVWACKTFIGRLTTIKIYNREDYEQLQFTIEVEKKVRIRPTGKHAFVQSNYIRDMYDSFQMLEVAKSKTYIEQLNKDIC